MTTPFRLVVLLAGLMLGHAAAAQTVMLPSAQTFRYSGSVLVPDRGTAHLGGTRSAASGQSRRGWRPGPQSFGSNHSTSSLSVRATIIDHQEIDRQLLGETPEAFVQRKRAAQVTQPTPLEEGKKLVRHARRLVQSGDLRRAESAYRLAISLLPEPLKAYAKREYRSVLHQPSGINDPFGGQQTDRRQQEPTP